MRRQEHPAEEDSTDTTVDVLIPVDAEAARAPENPARRNAVGRYVSGLLKAGRLQVILAETITDAKHEVRLNGLTDEDIDAELEAWRNEHDS